MLSQSRLLQRGFLPYIVASQTVPILAIAPMVVVWVNPKLPGVCRVGRRCGHLRLPDLLPGHDQHAARAAVSRSAGGRADALVCGEPPWRCSGSCACPASFPFLFTALKIAATAGVVGAIIGELPSSIQDGLGGAILNFNQYYVSSTAEPLGDEHHRGGARDLFFAVVALAEKLLVRRAPENVA